MAVQSPSFASINGQPVGVRNSDMPAMRLMSAIAKNDRACRFCAAMQDTSERDSAHDGDLLTSV